MNSILNYESVALDEHENALVILDQTRLPNEIVMLHLTDIKDIRQAIYTLQVRGAPAIGIAAAFGLYLAAKSIHAKNSSESREEFLARLHDAKEYLNSARPTAVNLSWALSRMKNTAVRNRSKSIPEILEALKNESIAIKSEDTEMCR